MTILNPYRINDRRESLDDMKTLAIISGSVALAILVALSVMAGITGVVLGIILICATTVTMLAMAIHYEARHEAREEQR